jgi:hypothetical protein
MFAGSEGGWTVLGHVTNEGEGAAFNVRWGVSFFGIRFAYRLDDDDPGSGNRLRVIQPRASVPPEGSWQVVVSSVEIWGGDGVPEDSCFYWARYEDERRRTWETFNSGDRSKSLRIRNRVRFVRLREWREERLRQRFREKGWEKERKIVAELSEMRDQQLGKGSS